MKFLNALQEDAGNNFYLVPMNIVNRAKGGGGAIYPGVRSPPPHACFHFYVMIKGMKRACHLKFLNALQEDAGNNFFYLVPMNIVNGGGGGGSLPQGKVSPPPSALMHYFHILCYDKGNEKSLVICSF